jgi:hypothetical protein
MEADPLLRQPPRRRRLSLRNLPAIQLKLRQPLRRARQLFSPRLARLKACQPLLVKPQALPSLRPRQPRPQALHRQAPLQRPAQSTVAAAETPIKLRGLHSALFV